MKKYDKTLSTYNNKYLYVCTTVLLCLFFMLMAIVFEEKIFAVYTGNNDNNLSYENVLNEICQNENPLDLEKIIQKNTSKIEKRQRIIEEVDMEYITRYKQNSELSSGVVQVLQEGRIGQKKVVIEKKYINDVLVSEEQISDSIIKAPVERIVEIGTGVGNYTYKASVGENVYVVSNSVAVRLNADENSEKICTLNQNDSVKVMKIEGDWYFISNIEIKGYLPSNCVTTKNPNTSETENGQTYSKNQILANLNFSMDLRKKSGLTLEQFRKVFSNDANDKNHVFAENADYFYYAEKQYGINGIFVAAVAIHESGWGTSTIAKNKKNLFGYGAVDSNPYGGAYSFETYSEGIDMVSRVFVKYYLNPSGTQIYDGNQASGRFYSGSTLTNVNSKYASDKNWANGVYKWMQYLYNKI